jgi:hypothetical protein
MGLRIHSVNSFRSELAWLAALVCRAAAVPRPCSSAICRLALAFAVLAWMVRCSPPAATPTGPAGVYEKAKQQFAKGQTDNYEKALDSLESLTNADQPSDYAPRARVLRAIILSGEMEGYRTLFEAYSKGATTSKNPQDQEEYTGLRRNTLQRAAELGLHLGEVTMQLTKGGTIAKELTLEAPYPGAEPPDSIPALDRVKQGLKIGRMDEDDAALIAPRIGVASALASVLHGDQAKVKSQLGSGPVNINGADFALFIGDEVTTGASFYDKKHLYDPDKFKVLTDIANGAAAAAQAALKESPNPEQTKQLKKLQDRIKASIKAQS